MISNESIDAMADDYAKAVIKWHEMKVKADKLAKALERIAKPRPMSGPLNLTDIDMQDIASAALEEYRK